MPENAPEIRDYLAARGGPFYDLQRELGLLKDNAFRAAPRAALFVGVAWVVPLILAVLEGHAVGPLSERPFLLDPGPAARFLVAIGLFMLMELQVERKLRTLLKQFVRAPLIAPSSFEAAANAVTLALRRRDNRLAEIICLGFAAVLTVMSYIASTSARSSSWFAQVADGSATLTITGWWCLLVSGPIFWFLLARWLWRHHVWGMLLKRLAGLDLRLTTSHPDGRGGLTFIGQYPNAYATFVLALSCVVGAAIGNQLLHATLTLTAYSAVMAAWLAIVLGSFAWPLLAFARPLSRLKEETTLLSSAQATRRTRAVEREVLGRNIDDPDEPGDVKSADIADPAKLYDSAQKLSSLIVTREALIPISAAALLPLVLAGATTLPIKELVGVAKHLLLL